MIRSLALPLLAFALSAAPIAAQEAGTPRPVVSEIITNASASLRAFPGLVRASQEVNLAFLVGGMLESRDIRLGDAVKAQQLLARLNQTSLADDATAAQANLRAALAQAEIAQQAYARAEELNRRGVASVSVLETAQATMQTSAAAARAAQAAVTRAEDAAAYASLRAPQDGVITAILAEPGTTLTAGQPIATLASAEGREAVIDVPSAYLPLFEPEAKFLISARLGGPSASDHPLAGRVRLIEPVADSAARMHRLRITLDDADGLRLGSLITARLDLEAEQVLSLPVSALQRLDSGPQVWRITPERRLEPVPVTLGPEIDGRVIVTKGLHEGDEILTRGIQAAHAGQSVGERITP